MTIKSTSKNKVYAVGSSKLSPVTASQREDHQLTCRQHFSVTPDETSPWKHFDPFRYVVLTNSLSRVSLVSLKPKPFRSSSPSSSSKLTILIGKKPFPILLIEGQGRRLKPVFSTLNPSTTFSFYIMKKRFCGTSHAFLCTLLLDYFQSSTFFYGSGTVTIH